MSFQHIKTRLRSSLMLPETLKRAVNMFGKYNRAAVCKLTNSAYKNMLNR